MNEVRSARALTHLPGSWPAAELRGRGLRARLGPAPGRDRKQGAGGAGVFRGRDAEPSWLLWGPQAGPGWGEKEREGRGPLGPAGDLALALGRDSPWDTMCHCHSQLGAYPRCGDFWKRGQQAAHSCLAE